MKRIIASELNLDPSDSHAEFDSIFENFGEEPIGSASIGQVHG